MRSLGWNRPTDRHFARCKAGPHARDLLSAVVPADSADLTRLVTVIDQNGLGSCTANAVAQVIHGAQVFAGAPVETPFLSRLMAYYLARLEDGNQDSDAGSQICTVFDAVCRIGFCPESVWPYVPVWFKSKPPMEAFWSAIDQRGKVEVNYHRLDGNGESGEQRLDLIRKALTVGCLVTWGAPVSDDYCSDILGSDPIPPPIGLPIAGGHAQTLCGYGMTVQGKPFFRNVNSWGPGWGDGGFCDLAPEYVGWSEASDFWLVSLAPRFSGGTP